MVLNSTGNPSSFSPLASTHCIFMSMFQGSLLVCMDTNDVGDVGRWFVLSGHEGCYSGVVWVVDVLHYDEEFSEAGIVFACGHFVCC